MTGEGWVFATGSPAEKARTAEEEVERGEHLGEFCRPTVALLGAEASRAEAATRAATARR